MLKHSAILIAEDQLLIALDLAFAIEDAGGRVVGPASSIKQALALLETHTVVAAILDVNLSDGDVTPVVEYLVDRGVPLIVQSGIGPTPELAMHFPDLIVRAKPTVAAQLVAEIEALLVATRSTPTDERA